MRESAADYHEHVWMMSHDWSVILSCHHSSVSIESPVPGTRLLTFAVISVVRDFLGFMSVIVIKTGGE